MDFLARNQRTILATFLLVASFLMLLSPTLALAQSGDTSNGTLGVARMVQINDKNIKNGSIVSSTANGIIATNTPYDPQVLGVVARDAGIILNNTKSEGVPVISVGTVYVWVAAKNGPIKKGDLLASSTIPGVGVKADRDGYVLGSALEDYDNSNPTTPGLIAAEVNLQYFNSKPTFIGSLTDILKLALLPTKDSPSPIYKYIVAALVVLGSFVLAFFSFGRTAAKGVEALGRNPAASRIIHLGIIFNVAIVVIIVLAGLTVAFLILRL